MFEIESIVVNVDAARKYMLAHEKRMEKLRRKYIKELYKDIKRASKRGEKYVLTKSLSEAFMTYDYMMELKSHFEKLGFTVTEKGGKHDLFKPWLKISWED